MMEKIKLTKRGQVIFRSICKGTYQDVGVETDQYELLILEKERLITIRYTTCGLEGNITRFGAAYYQFNPTLANPTIWDDTKYIITTSISILAILISAITLMLFVIG